jgi:hypothetical protein
MEKNTNIACEKNNSISASTSDREKDRQSVLNDLPLSTGTRKFVLCLLSLNNLKSDVYDAIYCQYDEYQVEKIMKKYNEYHDAIENEIGKQLIYNIVNNFSRVDITEI